MLSFDEVKERLEQLSRQPTAVVGSGSYVARWRGLTYGEVYEHEAEYIAATNLLEQFIRDITPEDDLRENDQRVVLQEEVMRIFSIEVSSVFLEVARANWDDAHRTARKPRCCALRERSARSWPVRRKRSAAGSSRKTICSPAPPVGVALERSCQAGSGSLLEGCRQDALTMAGW